MPAAPSTGFGHLISDDTVLLCRDPQSPTWHRVRSAQPLLPGCTLLTPPMYRPALAVSNGTTVQLLGGTRMEIRPFDSPDVPAVTIAYGRIVLQAAENKRVRLGLRTGRLAGTLELDAGSIAAVEVMRSPNPGADPESKPGAPRLTLHAVRGQASWRGERTGSETRFHGPSQLLLEENSPQASPSSASIPAWVQDKTISPLDERASVVVRQAIPPGQSAQLRLLELTERRQLEVRWLAIRSVTFTGDFEPMIAMLNDPASRLYWPDCFDQLREAVSRDPADAADARTALKKRYGDDGRNLYRMLWGYTDQDLQGGEDAKLVRSLDHETLAARVLAFLNLKNITGLALNFRPEDPSAKRRVSVRRWEQLLEAGKIRLKTP